VTALLEANLHLSPDNQMNLLHLIPFFQNVEFRRLVMEFVTHPETRMQFDPEGPFEVQPEKAQAEWSGPITRGLNQFAETDAFSRVFMSPSNRVSIPQLLAEGKVVLLRLSRFSAQKKMGEFLAAALLPSILHGMEVFGWHRDGETGEERGTRARIFVDECRLFFNSDLLSEVMESALFEARKFRAQYFFFGQQPGQLPLSGQKALFGNTYAKLALLNSDPRELNNFASSMQGPSGKIDGSNIAGLPPYYGYARFQARTPDGSEQAVGPFTFAQLPPPDYTLTDEQKAMRRAVIERGRHAYYNHVADMDARRAVYVDVVMDELEQRLAQMPGAVIPSLPSSGSAPAAPAGAAAATTQGAALAATQGAAPAGAVAQPPSAADIWAEPSDPHSEALKTLQAIANGASGDAAPKSDDVAVKLDDSGNFTGW
jgi:hypothetical protein